MGNKTNEKKMTIYYAGSSQVINYFKTTKKRDLLSMAFKLFSLTQKHSFEELQKNYVFQNENGQPVVFDPQSFPDNSRINLTFVNLIMSKREDKNLPKTQKKENKQIKHSKQQVKLQNNNYNQNKTSKKQEVKVCQWSWDQKWNQQQCGYTLSQNNRKIEANYSLKGSMPILISNKPFTKGIHRWTIQFTDPMFYQSAGITSRSQFCSLSNYGLNFNSCPLFNQANSGLGDDLIIKILLDMDKRSVTINHKKINNLPSEVYAGICIKRDSGAYLNYD